MTRENIVYNNSPFVEFQGAKKMAETNSKGDIGAFKKEVEPPVEVSLPDIPDLHEAHCASMRQKYGHHGRHAATTDQRQTDKSSI